jgi:hypothetical protein
VLLALHKMLKYYVEGDYVDNHLGMDLEEFYTPNEVRLLHSSSGERF